MQRRQVSQQWIAGISKRSVVPWLPCHGGKKEDWVKLEYLNGCLRNVKYDAWGNFLSVATRTADKYFFKRFRVYHDNNETCCENHCVL